MIKIVDKNKCCGCSACVHICPQNAIELLPDEQGFFYPNVYIDACIDCNKCDRVCPILNLTEEKVFTQRAFLLQHKNEEILNESASGGAFTAIAEAIINMGGKVYGAAYDEKLNVFHCGVDNKKELSIFRNSKYVQSETRNSFREVKDCIDNKRIVCFSGTPCQIEGLLNYIGVESDYLYTVDVVCHAVPSPAVWKTYLDICEKKYDKHIRNVRFRDKDMFGYLYSQLMIEFDSGKRNYEGIETNLMLRLFFSEICNRPSCYECKFKKRYRRSDFTIWDCFDIEEFNPSEKFDLNKGISRMLIHSQKGGELLEKIASCCKLEEITPENALHFDAKEMFESVKKNNRYDEFWSAFYKNNEKALKKFFPDNFCSKAEAVLRRIFFRMGIYSLVRRMYKLIYGNRKR